MQSKGSALAFVFVLFVMCLGGYAAFTTLAKGRSDAVIPSESRTPPTGAQTTATSSIPGPTNTPEAAASPHSELSTPVVPTASPVPPPPTATLPPQPTPTATPSPTRPAAESTPAPLPHQFNVIRNERDCAAGGIIGGWVYDADGNGLPWVNMRLSSEWWSAPLKQSEGPPQSGKYEFAMGYDAALFRLLIVDDNNQPLSEVIDVDYQPDCSYGIDWQRVH